MSSFQRSKHNDKVGTSQIRDRARLAKSLIKGPNVAFQLKGGGEKMEIDRQRDRQSEREIEEEEGTIKRQRRQALPQ